MRHGRIDFSYHTTNIYFIVHTILNAVRKFANKYSLLKKNIFYRLLTKLIKKVKKELYRLSKSDTDYGNLKYKQFMRFLLNGIDPPLAKKNSGINIEKIPKDIDVIYHSSALRSIQSAKYIQRHFRNGDKPRIESCLAKELDEVKFSKNILSKNEFKNHGGLKRVRAIVLRKWYDGINDIETFQDSISRIEKLCDFIKKTSDRNILLITHGWYLRLLYMYFMNQEKSLKNLKSTKCIFKYGESFQVRLRQDFSPHISFSNNNKDTNCRPASLSDPKSKEQDVGEITSRPDVVKYAASTFH
jgi:broad specificity phosphatase PhoE